VAVCTCDYIDLPTNVALTNPGFVRLVNEANFGLKIATTSLGITASGTDTTVRFVVAAGGNVGIGTAAPTQQLHLVSNSDTLTLQIETTKPGATDTALDIKTPNREYKLGQNIGNLGAGKLILYDLTAGAPRLTLDTTGYVGIGTTAPVAPLDVNHSAFPQLVVRGSSPAGLRVFPGPGGNTSSIEAFATTDTSLASGYSRLRLTVDGTTAALIADASLAAAMPLSVQVGGAERLRISTAGNVGIGTTAPGYPLDVAGTVRCTSVLLGGDMLMFGALKNAAGTRTNVDQTGCYYAP